MKTRKPMAATLRSAEAPPLSPTGQPAQVDISVAARALVLQQGLYLIQVASAAPLSEEADEPFIRVSVPPAVGGGGINDVVLGVVGATRQTMTAAGGVAIADVRSRRGTLVISSQGFAGAALPALDIAVNSISQPVPASANRSSPPRSGAVVTRSEIALILGLRIERLGLRHFTNGGWAGSRGTHLGISELTLRTADPDAGLSFTVDAFTSTARASGRAGDDPSPVSESKEMPLVGFGVRIAPPHDQELTVVYMGAFTKAGIIGPAGDGAPCRSPMVDDALVAVDIWLRPRRPEAAAQTSKADSG